MTPKKRFETEKEILDAIAICHARSLRWAKEAEVAEAAALQNLRMGVTRETSRYELIAARKKKERAYRLVDSYIPRLGQKLAQFRTELLPLADNSDQSIPRRTTIKRN